MNTEIYYFSATGNSFAVARDIAKKLNGKLIPVISLIGQKIIHTDADVIGIVFPIYEFKPPRLIIDFISKLSDTGSKYIFAAATYGVAPLNVIKHFNKTIKSYGGKLSAGFAVKMPHNGLGAGTITTDEQNKMFKNWNNKLENICQYINSRNKGKLESGKVVKELILSGLFIKAIPAIIRLLREVIKNGWESLAFISDDKCDGCGICVKVCPVDNIKMVNKKPLWLKNCMGCFACIHWCPKESIQAGNVTLNMKRYHHPDVKIADIIKQKIIK